MFRFNLTVIYLLAIVLAVVLGITAVNGREAAVDADITARVERAHLVYENLRKLRDLRMLNMSREIATGELGAYLTALDDYDELLAAVEAEVHSLPLAPEEDEQAKRAAHTKTPPEGSKAAELMAEFPEQLANHLESLKGKEAWKTTSRADFIKATREELAACSAIYRTKCKFEFTYRPLKRVVDEVRADKSFGVVTDLVILTDARGTGLADADDPTWSNKSVAEIGVVRAAMSSKRAVRDVLHQQDPDRTFFVSAYPIITGGVFRGTLMLGVEIDEDLLKREKEVLQLDVSYLDGSRLVRSDLPKEVHAGLLAEAPKPTEEPKLVTITTEELAGEYVPIIGNTDNLDVHVALTTPRMKALEPLASLRTWILVGGIGLFFLGLIAFMIAMRKFIKPYEQLDAGVHEIIGGNHDYEFDFNYREKMWSSLAQSLNLMVGLLLGREYEEEGDWGEAMLDERPAAAPKPEPKPEPTPAAAVVAPDAAAELGEEPPEGYYRRIFAEFNDARKGSTPISYVKFVEKVVRQERQLKEEWGCRMVRFQVKVTDKGPSLIPVSID